jgi:hypothetical protein
MTQEDRKQESAPQSPPHEKWVEGTGEGEDYPGQTLATRSCEVVRKWAEERGAKPATIPGADPEKPRVLRLDFPGYAEGLQPVSWDAWCRTFSDRHLAALFQQHLKDGRPSNFFQLESVQK